jgi:hypothetical protein
MRLTHRTQVKEELRAVAPQLIAVAYVGLDWRSFVTLDALEEVIVSPTAGSSPDGIADLVSELGWERVHFVNELHAKIYIGNNAAAVGSFNLSANGLSGHALVEAGYIVESLHELNELRTFYDELKTLAQRQYPTATLKERQLSKLKEINNKLAKAGLNVPRSTTSRTLAEYVPTTSTDFYCSYYEGGYVNFNQAALQKQAPQKFVSHDTDPNELTKMHLTFLEKDDVHSGHWMLTWKAGEGTEIPATLEVGWMYINDVFPNGAVDEDTSYTKLAVQWKGARGIGAPPFTIGKVEKAALRELLVAGTFPEFLPHPDREQWSLNKTFRRFKEFVEAWKKLAVK